MSEIKEMTIEQVLDAVKIGDLTASAALELEKAGKNRSTLIEQLESLITEHKKSGDASAPSEQNQTEEPEKIKFRLLKNIKYNNDHYKIGEEVEIAPKDKEMFIKAGIIAGD